MQNSPGGASASVAFLTPQDDSLRLAIELVADRFGALLNEGLQLMDGPIGTVRVAGG
jgi:hypothetical protein